MKQLFKNIKGICEIIVICFCISLIMATNSFSEGKTSPETVTEKLYGERLPSIKKAASAIDIEVSEMLLGSESGFNTIFSREDKLELKTRELCTVSILSALIGESEELLFHISAAHKLGWTLQEIKEVQLLCIISAGWPKMFGAIRMLGRYCEENKIPMEEGLSIREDFHTKDWLKAGHEQGMQLFGKKEWEKLYSEMASIDPFIADFTVSRSYGKLYTRTVLDKKTKSLCMMSAYAALKSKKSLRLSIIAATNNGATQDQIKELLFHVGGYAGQEAVLDAIEVYKSIKP